MKAYNDTKDKTKLFSAVISHLKTYQNTSIKKANRIESVRAAKSLIEYVTTVFIVNDENDVILFQGLNLVLVKITQAIMKPDELLDFSKEIGFLSVLQSVVSDK